jgi:hypothetical protein
MYIVKNKAKSPKTVWDKKENKPLLTFKGGLFETEDKTIADKAKKLGYEVDKVGSAKAPEDPEDPEETPDNKQE